MRIIEESNPDSPTVDITKAPSDDDSANSDNESEDLQIEIANKA